MTYLAREANVHENWQRRIPLSNSHEHNGGISKYVCQNVTACQSLESVSMRWSVCVSAWAVLLFMGVSSGLALLYQISPNLVRHHTKPYQTLPQDCKGNPGGQRASPGADFTKPTLKWALLQPAPPYTWDSGGRPIVFTCVRSSDAHTICTYCTATVEVEEYIVERGTLSSPQSPF